MIEVFVLVDETDADERRAGMEEEAIDSKIEGVGWRVGRTTSGLPNVGRDKDSGVGDGWRRVGKDDEIGSLICFEMIWFFESDCQLIPKGERVVAYQSQ